MKKYLFTVLLISLPLVFSNAEKKNIIIHATDVNKHGGMSSHPRSPIPPPEVYIEGGILYFDTSFSGCTVQILQNDDVVYSDVVDDNGKVFLPLYLNGVFLIQFRMGSITFVGEIEL